jgi:hypothetical protein
VGSWKERPRLAVSVAGVIGHSSVVRVVWPVVGTLVACDTYRLWPASGNIFRCAELWQASSSPSS